MCRDDRILAWCLLFSFLVHASLMLASYMILPHEKALKFRIEFTPERFHPESMPPGMPGGRGRRGMQMWRGGEGPMSLPGPPGLPDTDGFGRGEGRGGTGIASIFGRYPYWSDERDTGPSGKESLKSGKGRGLGYSMVTPPEMKRKPGISRMPFDLKYDLLRIQDLEKSGYGAIAIIDPQDRRNLKGYVRLGLVTVGQGDVISNSVPKLSDIAWYINQKAKIKATVEGRRIELRKGELPSFAIAFLSAKDTLRTIPYVGKQDIQFFDDYLSKGGFLFVSGSDNPFTTGSDNTQDKFNINYNYVVYNQIKTYLQKRYGSQFRSERFDRNHPILHSFFDMATYIDLIDTRLNAKLARTFRYAKFASAFRVALEGLWLNDRLVAIYDPASFLGGVPSIQVAVNAVVFAVTQPGSLALQYYKEPETPPQRRQVEEQKCYLAIIKKGASVREIDLSQVAMSLDGRKLGKLVQVTGFDGILFRNLDSGKHRMRIEYSGRSVETEFDLKKGSVTTLTFGMDRFLFMTRLWMKSGDNLRKYDDWQVRQSNLRIAEITGISN